MQFAAREVRRKIFLTAVKSTTKTTNTSTVVGKRSYRYLIGTHYLTSSYELTTEENLTRLVVLLTPNTTNRCPYCCTHAHTTDGQNTKTAVWIACQARNPAWSRMERRQLSSTHPRTCSACSGYLQIIFLGAYINASCFIHSLWQSWFICQAFSGACYVLYRLSNK